MPRSPWWQGLDLRVLRHVRGVLARRGLALELVDQRPSERACFAPLDAEAPTGAGLAVDASARDVGERELVASMLAEAALDIATAMPAKRIAPAPHGRRSEYFGIVGAAPVMQDLYELIERVAVTDATAMIAGENGTGKELVARAIHARSARRDQPFVVTNCSAFNDNLLDSELFGHARGAFTGAHADKQGLFELADLGTFFLDEIGDMSPTLQVKVLRVLQEGTFSRVGDPTPRKVDVRIIAATNRDLSAMVASGQFRQDLYFRIHVVEIALPPLRERAADIPVLVDHFLARQRRAKKLTPACLALLQRYAWPGNVREIENEIERLVVIAGDAPAIDVDMVSPRIRSPRARTNDPAPEPATLPAAIEHLERRMIEQSMIRNRGNKTRAADELGVSRRNLIRLVQKYDLEQ